MRLRYRTIPASYLLSIALIALTCTAPLTRNAWALDAQLLRENHREGSLVGAPCPLQGNTNGSAANLRWYNVCSGYIWIFVGLAQGDAVGVRFGGPEQPAVNATNIVKRTITYFRNVIPSYDATVDVHVDVDANSDGCPDSPYLSDLDIDPGLRWNCSEFNAPIPVGAASLIVRTQLDSADGPSFATDGPYADACEPFGASRSFYYPANSSDCIAWDGPTARSDNFLYWLIVDGDPAPPVPVACCLPGDECQILLPGDCIAAGGLPRYDEKSCSESVCETARACCFPEGECEQLFVPDCEAAGGIPQGPGTECASFFCPTDDEACCLPNGSCFVLSVEVCEASGGTPMGPGTNCQTSPCPPQACCLPNGACLDLAPFDCLNVGGTPQGYGTSCATTPCPVIPRACCLPSGACVVLLYDECIANGGYPLSSLVCVEDLCTGACCFIDGSCQQLTQSVCEAQGGSWQGNATPCTVCSTPGPTGACCFADGSCVRTSMPECQAAGGVYQGDNTSCEGIPCVNATRPTSWGHIKGLYR
jgi:hypothetical protein